MSFNQQVPYFGTISRVKDNVTKPGAKVTLTPDCTVAEAEDFFVSRYTDKDRNKLLSFPDFIKIPLDPKRKFDTSTPTDEEIFGYIRSRRNGSAPGPDGIPFIVYKKCKRIRYILSKWIRTVFHTLTIPETERVAFKILIPKTSSSTSLCDFRDLTLFNASLKTVTGVWARRVRNHMMSNRYFDTRVQKGFLPKISGCLEHNQTLVDIIKEKIGQDKDVYLLWLDLENAFGSINHNLMKAVLKWYNVPDDYIAIIGSLYDDCAVKVVTKSWTTRPIRIEKGALQGGPEAGLLFNTTWNIGLELLVLIATDFGCSAEDKPIVGFADDLTLSTETRCQLMILIKTAEKFCSWAGLNFKDSKCKSFGVSNGSVVNPLIPVNGKIVPTISKEPFKFLGRLIYPALEEIEEKYVVDKFRNLMKMTDELKIDNRKKAWIYEHGVLPAMGWDFMVYHFHENSILEMEAITNRHLKKWLRLCKSADPSILFRKDKGLHIKSVRSVCMKTQVNKEIILACSRDAVVRRVASRRREREQERDEPWAPAKKLDEAIQRVTHKSMFKSQVDRKGLGHGRFVNTVLMRKDLTAEVNEIVEEEMLPRILSLIKQSKWLEWDHVIDLDLKWKEVMYAISPSTLSFILNAIQDTLPDPANLRRWSPATEQECGLCKWKNVTHVHILCGCKVALEQGRISYRHDSILRVIFGYLTAKVEERRNKDPCDMKKKMTEFVRKGEKKKKKKEENTGLLDTANDWVCSIDLRGKQAPFPPHILLTAERPDIVIYSNSTKRVILVELTSPAEENMESWREKKKTKYEILADSIRESSDWKVYVDTIEVGARGFVAKTAIASGLKLGLDYKSSRAMVKEMSRMAIRCSHFIWLNRNNKGWESPAMSSGSTQ